MTDDSAPYTPPLFALSAATYVERDGKILLLKRAAGEAPGLWYIPGGAVDAGETVEDAARRELLEEAGLVPSSPLTCIGVVHMHVYGYPSLQVVYACECADGDVKISHEHSGARWMDPVEYRERFFTDEALAAADAAGQRFGEMIRNVRTALDTYLRWREDRRRLAG
jgi:8-oxo-dGTP pyrophosphatase MutT (NUDIX family)